MSSDDLANASDEVTIWGELAAWKQRLELPNQRVQPTDEFGNLVGWSEDGLVHEA